jgi:hypothetical protein
MQYELEVKIIQNNYLKRFLYAKYLYVVHFNKIYTETFGEKIDMYMGEIIQMKMKFIINVE